MGLLERSHPLPFQRQGAPKTPLDPSLKLYTKSCISDSVGEGEGGMFQENSIETYILSSVKQITSPGWCMRQVLGPGALGRPRGIGWRGRWEGGPGWGIHVNPWLIHFNV